jgi:hypothetical protein
MASLPTTNRYTDLISYLPSGSFYESMGTIIPYRLGPTEVRLETGKPSAQFGFYLNDKYNGTVVSDSYGNVVFNIKLDRGDNELRLVDLSNGQAHISWLTVREYALWLAAYASVLTDIDSDLERVYNSLFVNQVHALDAEDRFGREIGTYNNLGLSISDYRRQLHELRLAYRNWGGRYRGLDHAVADFTQVPPFGYARRKWGPNWVLDQSMLINHRFKTRSHELAWSTTGISGVELDHVEADVVQGSTHQLDYTVATGELTWSPSGVAGVPVVASQGAMFLPGPPVTRLAHILGELTSFSVTVGGDDHLYLNIDDLGIIDIQLVTGLPTPSAAQIVGDINTALTADARYGAPYSTVASVYNSKVLIVSPTGNKVIIDHGTANAGLAVFGPIYSAFTFTPAPINGVYFRGFPAYGGLLGTGTIVVNTLVSPPTITWAAPFGATGAAYAIPAAGTYTIPDGAGSFVFLYADPDEFPASAATVASFTVGWRHENERISQSQGLWIVCDPVTLPGTNASDNVVLSDDATLGFPETPDNWLITAPLSGVTTELLPSNVTEGRIDLYDPCEAFLWHVHAIGSNSVTIESKVNITPMPRPGPRGSNYPQQSPGLFYDYENYEATLSGWVRSFEAGGTTTATLSFSWDDGATWSSGTPTTVVAETDRYEELTFVSFSAVIPATLIDNGVRVQVVLDSTTADVDVDLDSFRVSIDYISSAFLSDTTIPRSRHRQYFGELMWVWAPEALTLNEKAYIGLQHKKTDRKNPFSGVEITDISADTPAGTGTVSYSYNRVGDVRQLKWDNSALSWLPAAGWVTVISDGAITLSAVDGSYITVYVTYSLLPILSGSPPAVEKTQGVTISDTTVEQGHIRTIAPAHSSIDIFDVTEYDSLGVPINLKGAVTEGDFSGCTKTNLDLQPSDPFKYSYLYPSDGPVEAETLTVDSVTYLADLDYTSDQDQDNAVLYIDNLPLFNIDPATGLWAWRFTTANQIEIRPAYFSATSIYKIDYNLLYDITLPVTSLGTHYQDYAWWADYYLWDRHDAVQGAFDVVVPVLFNTINGRAYLVQDSTMDMSVAILYRNDASGQNAVPQNSWRFLDSRTIEIDSAQLVTDAQYTLFHQEQRVYETSRLTISFQHRSGATALACASASWTDIARNEAINVIVGHEFHQLKLTVGGIRDVRDFKIRSAVFKGLHLYGSGAYVPGLTDV